MTLLPPNLAPADPLTWRTVVARCLLGSTVKTVAYTLANYSSSDGSDVRPGVALLMKDCELGDRTVRDALAKLRDVGLVWRTFSASAAGVRDKADEYQLTFPDDLESRVAMWDPKRRRVTRDGVEMAPPQPHKRQKKAQAPATDAGGPAADGTEPPATPADGSVEETGETGQPEGLTEVANAVNHRQLVQEPPATGAGTTGNSCRPPSHAPSHAPSQHTLISPYGAEVEVAEPPPRPKIEFSEEERAAASAYLARLPDFGSCWMETARDRYGEGAGLADLQIIAARLAREEAA